MIIQAHDQRIIIGKPSETLESSLSEILKDIARRVPGLVEAHVPQIFILGATEKPTLSLVVVSSDIDQFDTIKDYVSALISGITPPAAVSSWVLAPTDPILTDIRNSHSRIL